MEMKQTRREAEVEVEVDEVDSGGSQGHQHIASIHIALTS